MIPGKKSRPKSFSIGFAPTVLFKLLQGGVLLLRQLYWNPFRGNREIDKLRFVVGIWLQFAVGSDIRNLEIFQLSLRRSVLGFIGLADRFGLRRGLTNQGRC